MSKINKAQVEKWMKAFWYAFWNFPEFLGMYKDLPKCTFLKLTLTLIILNTRQKFLQTIFYISNKK